MTSTITIFGGFVLKQATRLALIFLTFILISCKTPLLLDKSTPLIAPNKGIVFCTFSHDISEDSKEEQINSMTIARLKIQRIGSGPEYLTTKANDSYGWPLAEITRRSNSKIALITAITLDPGDYEIISREAKIIFGVINYDSSFPLPKPHKFTVKANDVIYVGSHHFSTIFGKNLFSQTLPYSCKFKTFDNFQDDKDLLTTVRPESNKMTIINGLKSNP